HWPLWAIDERGRKTGTLVPAYPLAEGDLVAIVARDGPANYAWPPTSGNAWSRRFLSEVFPIPEAEFRTCPDFYLASLVPLAGAIKRLEEPQGCWRAHAQNNGGRGSFDERLDQLLRRWEYCSSDLSNVCRVRGIQVDTERWRDISWWHRIHRTTQEIAALVPTGETVLLVDEDQWAA